MADLPRLYKATSDLADPERTAGLTPREAQIHRMALAGFAGDHQARRADDLRVLDYFHLRGGDHLPRRRGESSRDWEDRPRQTHPLTRRVVKILCSKLYSPGPAREIKDDPESNGALQAVYRDNMIDQVMQAADEMATLLGVAAVQAVFLGDGSLKPVKLHLWDYSQLILFARDDDPTAVQYVVTIDAVDEQTRYRFWSESFVRTYRTEKLAAGQTAGGREARLVSHEDHGYGRLPFGFVFTELPTTTLAQGRLGDFLAERNAAIDVKIDRMDEAVNAYHTPPGYLFNCAPNWSPSENVIGEFVRVPSIVNENGTSEPRIEYPQPKLDIESGHLDIEKTIDATMEGLGVPQTLYRMDQASLPSGESQKAEQQPLVDYTEKRRALFGRWETDLAEAVLAVAGFAHGSEAAAEAGARGLNLSLRWPPGDATLEQIQIEQTEVMNETKSLAMVVQERYRLNSEDEAWEHLEKVAEQNERLKAMGLGPEAAADRMVQRQRQMAAEADPEADPNESEPPQNGAPPDA